MQKITRIYVGNYGIDMAWYDGITFDLTAPDTGAPTDTIINLENGGGKTTLLSFIFSCFETSQDRFLKHIQNKNHRFAQYFAADGLPGVVLVEWEMPSRVASGTPYRLVTGQAVAARPNADHGEVERAFFSFEANEGLRFESVPAPKLTMAPANSMAEFSRWLHESQKEAPDFFHTRTQQDWQKHLRDERLIDIEMLQLQVNFSAEEGGIDTGFLTFHSEPEFVRKFFDLTLDPERSTAVRNVVVNTCDKLRRKPLFRRRLEELEALQDHLTQFDTLAQAYRAEQESQRGALLRGGGLVLSLEGRHRERVATAGAEAGRSKAQETQAAAHTAAEKALSAEEIVLQSLRHHRNVRAAEDKKGQADTALTWAKQKLTHLHAARARTEITAAETQKTVLENQANAVKEELEPWRRAVDKHGARLRRGLHNEEERLRAEASAAEKQESTAQATHKALGAELGHLSTNETAVIAEQAKLSAQNEAFEAAKTQLLRDGLLEPEEETTAAVGRWTDTAASHRSEESRHLAEAQALRIQEQSWRNQAKAEGEAAARLRAMVEQRNRFLAEGQAEREALSQLSVMRLAVDADTADPDSPVLASALDRLIQSSERELTQSDVHLAELHASKASIDETGVAGSSRDVDAVIAWLRAAGVQSARAYNTYIAQAIPDAQQARALVTSHPARFLGVCVASAEFAKVRSLTAPRPALTAPVMISVTTLDPENAEDNRVVIPAADDAVFNVEAAAALLTTLEARLAAEQARRKTFADRHHEALAGKQRLAAYVGRYGEGKLSAAGAEVTRLSAEAAATEERAQQAETKAAACRDAAVLSQAAAGKSAQEGTEAQRHARTLQRFAEQHESGRVARAARLAEIQRERADIVQRRAEIALEQEQLAEAERTAYRTRVDLTSRADGLGEERGTLKYYDKSYPAGEELAANPQPLDLLRRLYTDALQTFETQEKDRLGLLHQQLDGAREKVTEKTQAFTNNFPGVTASDIAPFLSSNFDAVIPVTQAEVNQADSAARGADRNLAVVKDQFKAFHKASKPAYAPGAEMEALDDAALSARIEQVATLKIEADDSARAAKGTSVRAKELARQAEAEAKEAQGLSSMLRAALSLPELIVADPVTLGGDIPAQAETLVHEFNSRASAVNGARTKAHRAFDALKTAATRSALQEVEPEIAAQLQHNDFDAACADSQRLLGGILDRIGTTQSSLDGMQADFDACVGELVTLTNSAITLLNSAVNNKKVPAAAPYVGGKTILKMRARLQDIPQDARRQSLQNYLDSLIDTNIVPAKGPEMVADALLRIHGKALGLQVLKMVPDEALQYVPVDKIQNSGGEGVVMAMFLYLLINQLRAETQARLKKTGGGPLILDNPFAKATTPTLWKAQRLLAQSMDVQLIFATALPDYNTIGEFSRFIRLRKAGRNNKTGRWHLQAADLKLHAQEGEPA